MGNETLPRRKRLRLEGYDYTLPGAYFFTAVTHNRQPLFGEIVNDEMRLNSLGEVVQRAWEDLPNHYPHVRLGAFVIMPNHVHGIIVLSSNPLVGDGLVGDGLRPSPTTNNTTNNTANNTAAESKKTAATPSPTTNKATKDTTMVNANTLHHGLPEIVRAFKSFSARRINILRHTPGVPVWQRGYHDRIIRNEDEWERLHAYILDNPRRWAEDRLANDAWDEFINSRDGQGEDRER